MTEADQKIKGRMMLWATFLAIASNAASHLARRNTDHLEKDIEAHHAVFGRFNPYSSESVRIC